MGMSFIAVVAVIADKFYEAAAEFAAGYQAHVATFNSCTRHWFS